MAFTSIRSPLARWALLTILLTIQLLPLLASAADIKVFDQRVEVPKPDGSGVAFIQLQADSTDPNYNTLTGFRISEISFISGQSLTLYNSTSSNCNGAALSIGDDVPTDGKVCFHSDNSLVAEFENQFKFKALSTAGAESSIEAIVRLINYNKQLCTGIPDLGNSQTFRAPPTPTVSIVLDGLQIRFTVTAAYLRNETSWFLDFFDYDITPATGDSADGTGRSCANHARASFPANFANWWTTAPRATYDHTIDASIKDALNNNFYPIYQPATTEWAVTAVDCDTVQFQATIPISKLVRNETTDCKNGNSIAPATTPTGLVYNGALYANAIRPRDSNDANGGYFKTSFLFPFRFSIQETVSNIGTISTRWSFTVNVQRLTVDRGTTSPGLMLLLQTSIDHPTLATPDISAAALLDSPHFSARPSNLTRIGDNSQCDGSSTSPCVIQWFLTTPELTLASLSNDANAFALQYVGNWVFQFTAGSGKRADQIQVNIYIDSSAADPDVNLDQLPVTSSLEFFKTRTDMQTLATPGAVSPTFSSGEQIWVRHSFQVDPADVKAFTFTLKEAYVCWSPVPGFVPSLTTGFGCAVDIPGVMEESQGQRIRLYDRTDFAEGIADVISGPAPQHWNWTLVPPTDAGWTPAELVHSGFGINALPLATTDDIRTYYFHIVSTVSQTALGRRGDNEPMTYHTMMAARSAFKDTGSLESISVRLTDSAADGSAGNALRPSWIY